MQVFERLRAFLSLEFGLGTRRWQQIQATRGGGNHSFSSYSDSMQTPPFDQGIDELLRLVPEHPVAILCAEAVRGAVTDR